MALCSLLKKTLYCLHCAHFCREAKRDVSGGSWKYLRPGRFEWFPRFGCFVWFEWFAWFGWFEWSARFVRSEGSEWFEWFEWFERSQWFVLFE